MKTAIIIILIILLILCIIAMVQASIIAHGRRQTMDESWQWQQDNVEATHSFTRDMLKDYTVKGPKGVDIHVSVLPAKEESDKYMILAHGYTDTRYGMMKYVPHYYELGFNCIMFDERGHGENIFEPCTYGVREVEYLLAVLRDTLERYGSGIKLGLHGESMGGGTVLYSLKYDEVKNNVLFTVDDCGYADIIPVLKGAMKATHIPPFMVYPAALAAKLMYGVSFPSRPFIRSSMISSGSSSLGLSEVMIRKSELSAAAAAIRGLLAASLFPPQPNRHFTLPSAPSFIAERTFARASGV